MPEANHGPRNPIFAQREVLAAKLKADQEKARAAQLRVAAQTKPDTEQPNVSKPELNSPPPEVDAQLQEKLEALPDEELHKLAKGRVKGYKSNLTRATLIMKLVEVKVAP